MQTSLCFRFDRYCDIQFREDALERKSNRFSTAVIFLFVYVFPKLNVINGMRKWKNG